MLLKYLIFCMVLAGESVSAETGPVDLSVPVQPETVFTTCGPLDESILQQLSVPLMYTDGGLYSYFIAEEPGRIKLRSTTFYNELDESDPEKTNTNYVLNGLNGGCAAIVAGAAIRIKLVNDAIQRPYEGTTTTGVVISSTMDKSINSFIKEVKGKGFMEESMLSHGIIVEIDVWAELGRRMVTLMLLNGQVYSSRIAPLRQ